VNPGVNILVSGEFRICNVLDSLAGLQNDHGIPEIRACRLAGGHACTPVADI